MATKNAQSQFVEYLAEVFRELGGIESKRMFGGHGIYHQGLIFGIVVGDMLYLKTDDVSVSKFEAAGSIPFRYEKDGKTTTTSYYSMPAEAFDDPLTAKAWASTALDASIRARGRGRLRKPTAR